MKLASLCKFLQSHIYMKQLAFQKPAKISHYGKPIQFVPPCVVGVNLPPFDTLTVSRADSQSEFDYRRRLHSVCWPNQETIQILFPSPDKTLVKAKIKGKSVHPSSHQKEKVNLYLINQKSARFSSTERTNLSPTPTYLSNPFVIFFVTSTM